MTRNHGIGVVARLSSLVPVLVFVAGCHHDEPPAVAPEPIGVSTASKPANFDSYGYIVTIQYFKSVEGGFKPVHPKKPNVYRLTFVIDKDLPNNDGYMIATIKGQLFDGPNQLRILHSDARGKKVAQPGLLTDEQMTHEFDLTFDLSRLGLQLADIEGLAAKSATAAAPAAAGSGGGQKVSIHLNNFAPDNKPANYDNLTIQYFKPVTGPVDPKKPNVYRLTFVIDKDLPNDDGYMIAIIKGQLFNGPTQLVVLHSTALGKEVAQSGLLTNNQMTHEFDLTFDLSKLGLQLSDILGLAAAKSPTGGGPAADASGGGQKVSIYLNNYAPDKIRATLRK